MPLRRPTPAPRLHARIHVHSGWLRRGVPVTTAALGLALALTSCGGPGPNEQVVGTSTPSAAVTAEPTSIFQLSPGQCFDRPTEDGLYEVPVVPCQVAHDLEMYALFQLDHPSWPGAGTVADEAESGCREHFTEFTGATPEDSELSFTLYTPSEGSWSEGDRQVQCALERDSGGRLIGSQAGAAAGASADG